MVYKQIIEYTLKTSPDSTDQIIGIDSPGEEDWTVARFNLSDLPISDPVQTALNLKADVGSSGTPTIQADVPITSDDDGYYIAPVASEQSRMYYKVAGGVYNITDGGYTAF